MPETTTTVPENQGASPGETTAPDFDEDSLVRETIEAGRGDRDEPGIRDQWLSDEHLGEDSVFDSRKPVSAEVGRRLERYGLECEGCDHETAVRAVNAYVRETKKLARAEKEAREWWDSLARRVFAALVVAALSCAAVYRRELGLEFLLENNANKRSSAPADPRALRARRQKAADAAAQRQQSQQQQRQQHNPTWLDNEKGEVWSTKQEKQFQTALREFSGVPKKERYKLIAAKVHGKSRIECLTHHRMQELLAKHNNSNGKEE